MDNLRFHHAEDVIQIVTDAGHNLVFLPAYSPFLSPIENLFNQLKDYVKRFKPSTADDVFNGVKLASKVISETDCKNHYENMEKYIPNYLDQQVIEN